MIEVLDLDSYPGLFKPGHLYKVEYWITTHCAARSTLSSTGLTGLNLSECEKGQKQKAVTSCSESERDIDESELTSNIKAN